jgi:hypothetical protein
MDTPARKFVKSLGGYQAVADSLNKKPQTVHTAMQSGVFPAAWYDALCKIAIESHQKEPPRALFSFLQVGEQAA